MEQTARSQREPYPLPIHIMDSDIYAYTPAVLLGTVDKLALIGQSARTLVRVLGMFGFPAWHHADPVALSRPGPASNFARDRLRMDVKRYFRSTTMEKSYSSIRTRSWKFRTRPISSMNHWARFRGCLRRPFITHCEPWRRCWGIR